MKYLPQHLIYVFACLPIASFGVETSKPSKGFDASIGIGIASTPKYEGSKENRVVPIPLIDLKLNRYGLSFGSSGIGWQLVDGSNFSFGLALGFDSGRKDKDTSGFLGQGSERLRGMGEIKPTVEYGFRATAQPFGLPINVNFRKAPRNKGHGGAVIDIGTGLPLDLVDGVKTNFSVGLSFVDKNYMRSYFGVSADQAAPTSFRAFSPSAGLKSANVGIDASYNFTKNWFIHSGVSAYRLLGDAAKSPIVERKVGATISLDFGYHF